MPYPLNYRPLPNRGFALLAALLWLWVFTPAHADTVYRVKQNDTLTGVARDHGLTVKELARHNDLSPEAKLQIGQRLSIPGTSPSAATVYTLKRGDTLSALARRFGVNLSSLVRYNGLRADAMVRAGQKIRIPPRTSPSKTGTPSTLNAMVKRAIQKAPVKSGRWKHIVLHHSATPNGSVRGMDQYHREVRHMENGLAYHFVIGNGHDMKDGEIAVGSRWTRQLQGGHLASESLNQVAIGICLVGNFDKTSPTARQLKSLDALVDALLDRCRLSRSVVKTHQQINPVHTRCPGRNFASSAALRRIQGK